MKLEAKNFRGGLGDKIDTIMKEKLSNNMADVNRNAHVSQTCRDTPL